ncbi:hypothetical protein PoB_005895900 [Plakobranchus ocellatus]|uniref:Uncharacterized protein n=1 Tax=Plakobranchus ocellatus TaxID=259542 RepID=A0AAV4CM75_9GAST|nr:hypothetical protein PoB_005895900 [Plakobranchus ocellatus]
MANPQQGDIRLSGPPSGHDAGGGARTRDRKVRAHLSADSLAIDGRIGEDWRSEQVSQVVCLVSPSGSWTSQCPVNSISSHDLFVACITLLDLSAFCCLESNAQLPVTSNITSPQQGDLRFSGRPSGQGEGGARTRDRRVPCRADSLSTLPPKPLEIRMKR